LPWQADDIDGVTTVEERVEPGEFANVAIEEVVDDYDFRASLISRVASIPKPAAPLARRALPMASIGSYGR
jgi:hypothetical protein